MLGLQPRPVIHLNPQPLDLWCDMPLPARAGEVATASVACGVLGVGGNKGAVAVEFTVFRRKVAVVCSHFAAHQVGPQTVRNLNPNPEKVSVQND